MSKNKTTNPVWKTAMILTLIPHTGMLGVQDYYLGNIGRGILKTCTANFFIIGWVWDILKIFNEEFELPNGGFLERYIKVNTKTSGYTTKTTDTPKLTTPPKPVEAEKTTPVAANKPAPEPSENAKSMFIRVNGTAEGNRLVTIPNYGEERPETEYNSYVDFENGVIYKKWGDAPTDILGYYDTTPILESGITKYRVFDPSKKHIIATLCSGNIYFRRLDTQSRRYTAIPDEVCLAYYGENNGSIKPSVSYLHCFGLGQWALLENVGLTDGPGSENAIGGAASFVAYMYNYNFHCIFSDFYALGYEEFEKKYPEETP